MTAMFPLGHVVATPGALEALLTANASHARLLNSHISGDWGELDAEDKKANKDALAQGLRIFSSYTLPDGVKLWLITEADRSVTTLLLPEEY